MKQQPPSEVSLQLQAWRKGDRQALEALLPFVYKELRRLAQFQLQKERPDHTLQSTGLQSTCRPNDDSAPRTMGRVYLSCAEDKEAIARPTAFVLVSGITGALTCLPPLTAELQTTWIQYVTWTLELGFLARSATSWQSPSLTLSGSTSSSFAGMTLRSISTFALPEFASGLICLGVEAFELELRIERPVPKVGKRFLERDRRSFYQALRSLVSA